jgi:hypothetical protein
VGISNVSFEWNQSREEHDEVEYVSDVKIKPEERQEDTFENGCDHTSHIAQTHFVDSDFDVNLYCEDMDTHSQTIT